MTIVLDGGVATALQQRGHDLSGPLWSARLILEDPQAVVDVHRDFFEAGADVATTVSYQISGVSLAAAGRDPAQERELLTASVRLAQRARDEVNPDGLIAGSLGPYGASLGSGAEYTGAYHLGGDSRTVARLREFHRPRIAALMDAGVDLIAAETVPLVAEVEALAEELAGVPAWVSLTPAPGGRRTRTGVELSAAAEVLHGLPLAGLGVNCCPPEDVRPALEALSVAGLATVAYPNSGERWDPEVAAWAGRPTFQDLGWLPSGVALVGGCCRVGPDQIRVLAARVREQARIGPVRR